MILLRQIFYRPIPQAGLCGLLICGFSMVLVGCGEQPDPPPASPSPNSVAGQSTDSTPVDQPESPARPILKITKPETEPAGLHNLLQLTDRLYSGSEPHGAEGFASLEKLGIKTVVSVDGAKPALELARQHGLRYVHIPIGYDGVPKPAGDSLARLMRDAEGPIYIHCHHGKHRGPSAAAVACVADGAAEGQEALAILKQAGTSPDYPGLWRDVEQYVAPAADATLPDLVEVAEVDSLVAAMAQIDRGFDNLKLIWAAKWTTPADHPDLVPEQEALLVQEGFRESIRNLGGDAHEQLKTWLAEAEAAATKLQQALKSGDLATATAQYQIVEQSCKQCHKAYRDR